MATEADTGTTEGRAQAEHAYTPGPWVLATFPGVVVGGPMLKFGNGEGQAQLAMCTLSETIDEAQRNANARLISAAPDLLEALKGIVADDDASVSLADQRARSDARMAAAKAAILKATGGTE